MSPDDARFMRRCFELARAAAGRGELPFGSVITRGGEEIASAGNGVKAAKDITRHAEVCAIVAAEKALGKAALDGCTLYTNVEPCAFCSYAIRETRVARVVYALGSPVMGGATRWDVLSDPGLGAKVGEVFGPAPEIVAGFLADEADALIAEVAPLMWATSHQRGLFICQDADRQSRPAERHASLAGAIKGQVLDFLRRRLFDWFSRGVA